MYYGFVGECWQVEGISTHVDPLTQHYVVMEGDDPTYLAAKCMLSGEWHTTDVTVGGKALGGETKSPAKIVTKLLR